MNGAMMLWWDNSPKPLAEKVRLAAQYFRRQYERVPELCLVNEKMLDESAAQGSQVDVFGEFKIVVKSWRSVPVDHFLVGVDDTPTYALESACSNTLQDRESV